MSTKFKLIAKYLKSDYEGIEIKNYETLENLLFDKFGPCSAEHLQNIKKDILELMGPSQNESGLTMAFLEKYREKYEACITVTPENLRLYTRARFILNIFINQKNNYIGLISADRNNKATLAAYSTMFYSQVVYR